MRLSIIVPCYNERENIPIILDKFKLAIGQRDMEVLLVDNGSTDQSEEILKTLLPEYPFAGTVKVPVNQGYGYGILKGLDAAQGEFVGWTHADMQTDPADVIKAYDILERAHWNSRIFVKGNRKKRGISDQFFTMGMSIFETVYLGKKLYDVNAQPNIFSKEFYNTWKNPPIDFALDLYVLYMAQLNNLNVIRFPVLFPPRIYGSSHWNTGIQAKWKFIKRTINFSRKLKRDGIR